MHAGWDMKAHVETKLPESFQSVVIAVGLAKKVLRDSKRFENVYTCCPQCSNISSETAWPVKVNFV